MRASAVFTPNKEPDVTYVDDHLIEKAKQLRQSLETGAGVVSLSGPSKSGKTMNAQHKLLMEGPPGYLSRWTWRCSCGQWEGKVPDVGPFGRTTAKARITQVEMAHGKHAKHARAAMAKALASQT